MLYFWTIGSQVYGEKYDVNMLYKDASLFRRGWGLPLLTIEAPNNYNIGIY